MSTIRANRLGEPESVAMLDHPAERVAYEGHHVGAATLLANGDTK